MLLLLDTIQDHKVDVILAKENFDVKMAPIKAWVAGMELDALKERMSMGVKARLRAGKANTGQDRYGYQRIGEKIVIVEEEAKWIRQMFDWYIQRVPMMEIRQRLIAAGAPQKGSSRPRKVEWAVSSIQSVFKAAYEYAHGIKIQTRDGEVFEIPVEPIISLQTYKQFQEVREANKSYPSRHVKRDYLVGGLIYCDCERKWGSRGSSYKKKGQPRRKVTGVYFCQQRHPELRHPDCPKTIGSKKADDYVWGKLVEVLNQPEILINRARQHVTQLQEKANQDSSAHNNLHEQLEKLFSERQWIITQARKGQITEQDMDYQLAALAMQEEYVHQELVNLGTFQQLPDLDSWEEIALNHLEDLQAGLAALSEKPAHEEAAKEQFQLKRRIVLALVDKILIGKDREMTVIFKLNVLSLLGIGSDNTPEVNSLTHDQNKSVGTCSRRQSCLLRPQRAVCG